MKIVKSIEKLIDLVFGQTVVGLELFEEKRGTRYILTKLKKNEEQVETINTLDTHDINTVVRFCKKSPVILCFSGSDVMCKQSTSDVLQDVLPGVEEDKMMIKQYTFESQIWWCVIPKEKAQSLLSNLEKTGIRIVEFHLLGISAIENLHFLKIKPKQLFHHLFEWQNDLLSSYELGEPLPESSSAMFDQPDEYALSIISGLHFYYKKSLELILQKDNLWQSFFFKRLQAIIMPCILGLTAIVLVFNIVLRSNLTKKVNEDSIIVNHLENIHKKKLTELEGSISNSLLFSNITNINKGSYSEQLEDIARSISEEIELFSISIHPLVEQKKHTNTIDKSSIYIGGNAMNVESVSIMKLNLSELNWAKMVEIKSLVFDHKLELHKFYLKITVK